MPTDDRPILIDSNVLIFASTLASPFHAAALLAIEGTDEAGAAAWISAQIVREYLVHMTRNDVLGARTVADVVDQVDRLCRHYRVANDSDQVRTQLLSLMRRFGVQGKARQCMTPTS